MAALGDLKEVATIGAGVVGLITTLAPLANRFSKIDILQFGAPGLLNVLGGIASLTSFLCVYASLNSLQFFPAFPAFMVLFVVVAIFLFPLGKSYRGKARVWVFIVGALLYTAESAVFSFGITEFSVEFLMYHKIKGTLSTRDGKPAGHRLVFITDASDSELAQSRTNASGIYQFLVSKQAQVDKVMACLGSMDSGTVHTLTASGASIDYDLKECQ